MRLITVLVGLLGLIPRTEAFVAHHRIATTPILARRPLNVPLFADDTALTPDPADEDSSSNRIVRWFTGDGKFTKASLAKMGTNVLLSYGFVSNTFGCTCVSLAWYISSKRTGLSPLAPGQWKPFLAVYAGFFVFLNIIRPLRFGISIALSKYFERMLLFFQNRFQVNRAGAIGMLMFCVNFCGSLAIITVGIALASALSGVPVWAR